MKERLISNNLGLKILSLFLAFIIWLVVVNVSNPLVNRRRELTLEIENSEVLTAARRAYEISGKNTVTVSFDIHTRDEYKIRLSDFRAYIDLSELYDVTGSVPVKVEVLNNSDIYENVVPRPGVVRVTTEELQSKPFELQTDLRGEAASGYVLGKVTLTPDIVTVEGPISQVGLISQIGVRIQAENPNTDFDGHTNLVFYDANGNELEVDDRVRTDVDETGVGYQVSVDKIKELSLDFEVSGEVAEGYRYTGVECSRRSVSVTGAHSGMAAVNTVRIPASVLNIDGASQDQIVTVDIREFLPEGVLLARTEEPNVEIRLCVEALTTKTLELTQSNIKMIGGSEDLEYRLVPERIEVKIRGLEEELEPLSGEDLGASLNLAGLSSGNHILNLDFEQSDRFMVISQPTAEIEVISRSNVTEVGTEPSETTAETTEAESAETKPSSALGPGYTEAAIEAGGGSGTVVQGTTEESRTSE
ncbi:MAG: hypothetical protein HFG56_02330 [Lachnospiraceae bacterium]|jgi:YbbR domain-containing protein|nr:hypothetical protein [Lachnospiraceae bacterium]MCI9282110.1 hypothetical protein [Lachnospiraceae bacterium]